MATLASGTGTAFGSATKATSTIQKLVSLESALEPGTKVYFQGKWTVLHLPVVGAVHTGAMAAAAVNNAYQDGKFVSGGHPIPLWPGDKAPASYDGSTRTLTVRWRTASSFVSLILTALAGITVAALAVFLKIPPQVTIGLGIAVGL